MAKFTDKAREDLIEQGRSSGYGDITSRQMGAMGGTTTRNTTKVAKAVLSGNLDAVKDLREDDVFIKKTNDAKPLDIDMPNPVGDADADTDHVARRGSNAAARGNSRSRANA